MKEQGVTLLETIVVLVILAIGASIAVPKFQQAADTKRADSAIESLRTISHCMRLYMLEKDLPVFKNTPSPPPYNLSALDKLSTKIGGNGCFDFNMLEKTYDFLAYEDVEADTWGEPWTDWVTIVACDKTKDQAHTRVIFLRFGGDPTRGMWSYPVSDYRDTACPARNTPIATPTEQSKLIRQFRE